MANKTGRHMAPSKGGTSRRTSSGERGAARREALRDNYTYEQGSTRFEDVSSYSSSRRKKEDERELKRQKGKSGKRFPTAAKVAIAVVLVLALAVGGMAYYINSVLLKDLTVKPISRERVDALVPSEVASAHMDSSIKNILLLGLDARNSETVQQRSDAMMVVTVDNKHNKIKMTSILRDSDVSIRTQDDDGYYYYFDDKITHAYFWGGRDGPEVSMDTVNRNFFLNITDYVTVNFEQTAAIIDAVGGIDLELTEGEVYYANENLANLAQEVANVKSWDGSGSNYTYPEIKDSDYFPNIYGNVDLNSAYYEYEGGTYHLNGNQAVAYARIRHLDSDNVRASRQQIVISKLLETVRGKSKLEYPELIRSLMPFCETSLGFDDIVAMIPILLTDFTIETMSVPGDQVEAGAGKTSSGGWCYVYDLEGAARVINDFIYEDGAPAEIKVDSEVRRLSEAYRYGTYNAWGDEEIPEDDELPDINDMPEGVYIEEPTDEPGGNGGGEDTPYSEPGYDEPGGDEPYVPEEPSSSDGGGEDYPDNPPEEQSPEENYDYDEPGGQDEDLPENWTYIEP